MSELPMREASLIELMESLPKTHIARLEYIKFLSRLSEEKNERLHLEQENSRLKTDNSILEGDYQQSSLKLSDTYKQLADLKEENSDNESLLSKLEQENKELHTTLCDYEGIEQKISAIEYELGSYKERLRRSKARLLDKTEENKELKAKIAINEKSEKSLKEMTKAYEFFADKNALAQHGKEIKINMLKELREPFHQKYAELAIEYGIGGSECKGVAAYIDDKIQQLDDGQ